MLFRPRYEDHLDRLAERLRLAQAVTPSVMSDVVAGAGARIAAPIFAAQAARIERLIETGAWTDAALALIAVELPQWTLRRLVCEDGEWLCSLSRLPNLPVEFDDAVEARHDVLPLAILGALLEAKRQAAVAREVCPATVPHMRPAAGLALCCDNFA